jgi:hypothetical protein
LVEGMMQSRRRVPSTSDSHVPQSPISQPRLGRSDFAKKRIAHSADVSDQVANEYR